MNFKEILFILLLFLFALLSNGCMPKQADGKYHSRYSYHPYYKLYRDKMAGEDRIHKSKYSYSYPNSHNFKKVTYKRIPKRVKLRIKYNDEDLYPSNVPVSSNY